ncbi:MAG: hypothetical protein AB1585_21645 [Thermodesulfobacteriota bacterium]
MFRIRESDQDHKAITIWVDGRLKDQDLEAFRQTLEKYLKGNLKVTINLTYLTQAGWEIKRYLHQIQTLVELADLPEYLKNEILHGMVNF